MFTAYYLPQNAGDIARTYIKDPQLLSFIDAEVRTNICLNLHKFVNQTRHGINCSYLPTVFHCEHSQCFADANDQCKYGRILVLTFGVYPCFPFRSFLFLYV